MQDIIICGDCLEELPKIPDESVDMVFADPPFNIGKPYLDKRDNYREWCAEWVRECFRTLKETGSMYLMTLDRHLEWLMPIMASHGKFVNQIHWVNVSASHSKRRFWGAIQPILFYGKTKHYKFDTYAETQETGHRRFGGYSTEYKGRLKDLWDDIPFVYSGCIKHPEAIMDGDSNRKAHPCQMPEKLAARPIKFSTDPGDLVIDPFCGSGTSCVAAAKLGRHYIGIDIEEKFCVMARNRLADDLFLRGIGCDNFHTT